MAGDEHARLDRHRELVGEGVMEGILKWCELTLGQAVRQAPIAEGTLRASGTIDESSMAESLLTVLAGAVGVVEARIVFPLIYAAYQERGMRADGSYVVENHPKGGKIHYLSDPVKANAHLLGPMIAETVRSKLAEAA